MSFKVLFLSRNAFIFPYVYHRCLLFVLLKLGWPKNTKVPMILKKIVSVRCILILAVSAKRIIKGHLSLSSLCL